MHQLIAIILLKILVRDDEEVEVAFERMKKNVKGEQYPPLLKTAVM